MRKKIRYILRDYIQVILHWMFLFLKTFFFFLIILFKKKTRQITSKAQHVRKIIDYMYCNCLQIVAAFILYVNLI